MNAIERLTLLTVFDRCGLFAVAATGHERYRASNVAHCIWPLWPVCSGSDWTWTLSSVQRCSLYLTVVACLQWQRLDMNAIERLTLLAVFDCCGLFAVAVTGHERYRAPNVAHCIWLLWPVCSGSDWTWTLSSVQRCSLYLTVVACLQWQRLDMNAIERLTLLAVFDRRGLFAVAATGHERYRAPNVAHCFWLLWPVCSGSDWTWTPSSV